MLMNGAVGEILIATSTDSNGRGRITRLQVKILDPTLITQLEKLPKVPFFVTSKLKFYPNLASLSVRSDSVVPYEKRKHNPHLNGHCSLNMKTTVLGSISCNDGHVHFI